MLVEVEREMTSRHTTFSVGEIGEKTGIKFFCSTPKLPNLKSAEIGTKNVDACSRDGERYSIKTALKAKKTGTIYPDLTNPDKQLFEYLLIIKLAENFTLVYLYRFSCNNFYKYALGTKE
ncbi:MAG: hypothetical protein ABFD07_01140 [Methanobacterium sp.]